MKRIVVIPVDFTEHSKRALDWYAKRSHDDGEFLVVAHVLEMPSLCSASLAQCRVTEEYTNMVQVRISFCGVLRSRYLMRKAGFRSRHQHLVYFLYINQLRRQILGGPYTMRCAATDFYPLLAFEVVQSIKLRLA